MAGGNGTGPLGPRATEGPMHASNRPPAGPGRAPFILPGQAAERFSLSPARGPPEAGEGWGVAGAQRGYEGEGQEFSGLPGCQRELSRRSRVHGARPILSSSPLPGFPPRLDAATERALPQDSRAGFDTTVGMKVS